ncbi:hypothetical protein [Fimbriiglobus ruber]|uniref:Uncharacterized protein n=1 Tax=Fimbriiglobus ruber TaxID=1908690 RepID=A0A225D7K4_9BACT|nr:hypothetical protein [Fimbriiglobus ruber]OWK34528.1 hypothetical protein FRUB_10499 [Fimbriiglobus ruber]
MTELMVHVERVVRPVRAGPGRKMKMREELLAHLAAIYGEERARFGDDTLALRLAVQRFGDPAELTKELQATVPRVERFLMTPLPGTDWERRATRWSQPRPDESSLRHAARVAAVFAGFVLANICLIPVLRYASGVSWSALRIDPATAAVVTAHAFVSAMLCVGFIRATSGRLTRRSLLVAVACAAPLLAGGPVLLSALHALQSDNLLWVDLVHPEGKDHTLRVVASGLFWLVMCAVVCRFVFARYRRITEWTELEING